MVKFSKICDRGSPTIRCRTLVQDSNRGKYVKRGLFMASNLGKITAGLNERLKPAIQVFAADYQASSSFYNSPPPPLFKIVTSIPT